MKSNSNLENALEYREVVSTVPKFNVEYLNNHPFYHEGKPYMYCAPRWIHMMESLEENYNITTQ